MGIVYIITLNVIIRISALLLRIFSAVSVNEPALNYVCFLQNARTELRVKALSVLKLPRSRYRCHVVPS